MAVDRTVEWGEERRVRLIDRLFGDPATPPERRYMEYFLDGTQPGARAFDAWSIFRHGTSALPR